MVVSHGATPGGSVDNNNKNVTSRFLVHVKRFKELIWLPMSPKLTYFLRHTSVKNSRVKRAWAGVVKRWVTYQEVIRDSVRARPKHGERSWVIAGLVNKIFGL